MSGARPAISVIIVDRFALFRQGLSLILKEMPQVELAGEAENEVQALRLLQELKPDIVILNVDIFAGNENLFVRIISADSPKTKILLMGDNIDEKTLSDALESGVKGFLSKDSGPSCLLNALQIVAKGQLWVERKFFDHYFERLAEKELEHQRKAEKDKDVLTPREKEVLKLLAKGSSNKEIGAKLFISEKTVKSHLSNIFKKLKVNSRLEAFLYSIKREIC
ncbi:LuxR C-terminal-related transcriptional regulator [Desulforhopalus singaporensis]|uniref:DNA-binding response regulator, NarL/FixJ family, contains REC and HTH domains n=1 Tax=Desulforhopalus singaporensis TaxID=91360 RepID=A0A1H0V4B7_9BACT|nr:response regulator transcription factor [Desulforhopalus singaporensis]SDP73165.1 DNA-binding response regulator, NarL/FixJ family, contains REC and HTH domains [Desulforhopalus singaporensis]